MSARLAIGAVGVLAGLAALSRRGSAAEGPAGYMPPFAGLEGRRVFDLAHKGTDQNPMRDFDAKVAAGTAFDQWGLREFQYALDWMVDERAKGRWAANTYWYYEHPELSVAKLLAIPGNNNEHQRMHTSDSRARIEELANSMRAEGFHPQRAIQIFTWPDGQAKIWEGNHRLRAAAAAGLQTIPVDWRYVAGSERDPSSVHASGFQP
jgi:hypothetical protein